MHGFVATRSIIVVAAGLALSLALSAPAWAQWVAEGQVPEGKWMAGFRTGFVPLTQDPFINSSGAVGPVLNFQGMFGLSKYISAGLMLEWERHSVSQDRPDADLGRIDTVSLLPTVEIRPGRLGPVIPYGTVGIGVNVNSFSEASGVPRTSPSNTFAFRVGGGADYMLTKNLALNTELAWKRNRGGLEIQGAPPGFNFDASSFLFLLGVRYTFN